jgi:ureidoglycolate hydrolase
MDFVIVDLSEEALKGIGQVLTPRQWTAPEAGAEYAYADIVEDLGLGAPCSAGTLECLPRPMTLRRMERHLRTRELLIALGGEAVICLAPPQESAAGALSGITAVRVRTGQAFILDIGAWHWIPYPTGDSPARFLVVFRSGTGKTDLQYHDFPSGHRVRG